jgi:hypothetical protein
MWLNFIVHIQLPFLSTVLLEDADTPVKRHIFS